MITPILVIIWLVIHKIAKHNHKQRALTKCLISEYDDHTLILEATYTYIDIHIIECYGMSDFRYLRACEAEIQRRFLWIEYQNKLNEWVAHCSM